MTREELKQICQIYDNLRRERDAATIVYNSDDTFWDHILTTYNLSQPSHLDNLDEAAWEYFLKTYGIDNIAISEDIKRAVKFGVEWKAEQGETQIVETRAVFDSHGIDYGGRYLYVDLPDDTPIGTEFIVQIRKKQ